MKANVIMHVLFDVRKNKYLYMMLLPLIAYYLLFHYQPMYGAIIAFKDFSPRLGIIGSPWSGLGHFVDFFQGAYFWRTIRNTFMISFYDLIFGFPAPIILALLLNEVKAQLFKRTVQTITYLPHFISLVVICGMIKDFTSSSGVINDIIAFFGGERISLLLEPSLFRTIYVSTDIWQSIGWGTIIYLAALTGIDQEQYEAAKIDGAGRWKQMMHITIPGIMPTIMVLLILNLGRMMNLGFEKIILLYNPGVYETADVISSYVYRVGLQDFNYSFSSAVGLFNSAIGFILVISSNWISRKHNDTSLW
ncbi:sugar ABC transporter permease [Paenibacillus sp. FSL H8-0548]|uniref:ABC transporter permease n=1 Tax=Paenibacillus sp. FSL H8-0548 TaxID=1920422 RepID=UPI00096E87F7|nr:ABC transporter permease subunit [Paenibacillus sp. FSL H8-0548]OMF37980.1 sugar ABC transporter permease [Paenibacillus sp. FSL H8-0548]